MKAKRNAPQATGRPSIAAAADLDPLARARRLLRGGDALGVRLAVDELQGVAGDQMRVPLLEQPLVEEELAPTCRPELVVLAALRAHFEVRREGLGGERLPAAVALAEDALAERLFLGRVALGGFLVRPGHASKRL